MFVILITPLQCASFLVFPLLSAQSLVYVITQISIPSFIVLINPVIDYSRCLKNDFQCESRPHNISVFSKASSLFHFLLLKYFGHSIWAQENERISLIMIYHEKNIVIFVVFITISWPICGSIFKINAVDLHRFCFYIPLKNKVFIYRHFHMAPFQTTK